MSSDQSDPESAVFVTEPVEDNEEAPKRRLEIDVAITDVGPCKKHLKITIPRAEIDRQFEESLSELRGTP